MALPLHPHLRLCTLYRRWRKSIEKHALSSTATLRVDDGGSGTLTGPIDREPGRFEAPTAPIDRDLRAFGVDYGGSGALTGPIDREPGRFEALTAPIDCDLGAFGVDYGGSGTLTGPIDRERGRFA